MKFLAHSPLPVAVRQGPIVSSIEALESRIAPAVVLAPPVAFNYTDGDGDTVKVVVSGKYTKVELLSATNADVTLAGTQADIAKIVITGAGKDFAISFADTNVGVGNGIIELGSVSGPAGARLPMIKS